MPDLVVAPNDATDSCTASELEFWEGIFPPDSAGDPTTVLLSRIPDEAFGFSQKTQGSVWSRVYESSQAREAMERCWWTTNPADLTTTVAAETPSMKTGTESHFAGAASECILPLLSEQNTAFAGFFGLDDPPAVRAFLSSQPRVSAALLELTTVLRDLVPTAEAPFLRVVTDPLDLEIRELQVRVPLAMEAAEALAKIEEVDDAWWMRLPPEIRRLVTVDAVYR